MQQKNAVAVNFFKVNVKNWNDFRNECHNIP